MRIAGIALAVLALAFTSGGVAHHATPGSGPASESRASLAEDEQEQCAVPEPTLTFLDVALADRRASGRVQALNGTGYNRRPEQIWHPALATGAPAPPAAPRD